MAQDFCCGCTFEDDYGTSTVTGEGSLVDPFRVTLIDPAFIRPLVRVRRTSNQSIPDNTTTAVSFDTAVFDPTTMWVIGSPTRLTILTAGLYLMGGCTSWEANATGTRELAFRVNGTTELESQDNRPDSGSVALQQALSYLWFFDPGDFVELIARQESGGARNLVTQAVYSTVLWMVYIGKKV